MIHIFLENNYSRLSGQLPPYVEEQLKDRLAFVKKGHRHIESFKNEEWDGVIRLFAPGAPFYTGLLGTAKLTLDEFNIPYKVIDRRNRTIKNFEELEFVEPDWCEYRDYAEFTVNRSISKTRGIINIGTGGGKTIIVAKIIGKLKVKPFIFYVLTKDLLYQAINELNECLNCEIGQVGDGVVNIKDINVCTKDAIVYAVNKGANFDIKQYKFDALDVWDEKEIYGSSDTEKVVDMVRNCRGLYFDEAHHASANTCRDIVLASPKAYWRFGGTATFAREDGEEIVIQGLFGKRIVDISLTYLIKNKWLVPAAVFFAPVSFQAMPYYSYPQIYKHCVIDNDEVALAVAEVARYTSDHGMSNLILVSKIKHGERIKKLLPDAYFLTGRDTSKKRVKAIEAMRTGEANILIATTLADEGLDIRRLDIVQMVGAGASITRVPQRIGRVVRKSPGKKYGIGIYYHYCVQYLYEHGMKAKRLVKREAGLELVQAASLQDLKHEIIRYVNSKVSLFDES